MNKIDRNPDYRKLYGIVRKLYYRTEHFMHGPFDETYFTLRVYESCKDILKGLRKKCSRETVLAAAILHDIGKTRLDPKKLLGKNGFRKSIHKEWYRHARLGVPIARRILRQMRHSEEFMDSVCYLIENHDQRGDKLPKKSLELQVLQDADLIADCGFAGFIRPFVYGGKFRSQSIIDSILYLQVHKNRAADSKLINLKVSRNIALKKIRLERHLVKEISGDIKSDLL
jgi:HD superfamily phosphodiesterase